MKQERVIKQVDYGIPVQPKAKHVAAYARVSSGKDAMLHSLSAQVSYYNEYIQNHPGWLFCGVYADEAISGTKENREGYQRLLSDCRAGKIDMVLTKSISRFARNTVTLLATVRELKALGVDVFFEEQNLYTMSADGELMLTILASYAQEESRSVSENQKWRVRKNFSEGMPWNGTMLGYRYNNGQLVVEPGEAVLVKQIYTLFLSGAGLMGIVKTLNSKNLMTRFGKPWNRSSVSRVLKNYAYTGNLLLQTTYTENHITKRKMANLGQLPKYHAQNTHEAIISLEDYLKVQAEIKRRAEKYTSPPVARQSYPFTGKLICDCCGDRFRHKLTKGRTVWVCNTLNSWGKAHCASKQIPEAILMQATAAAMGRNCFDATVFGKEVDKIVATGANELTYTFTDGRKVTQTWEDHSRADSWTPEMREAVRQQNLQRRSAVWQTQERSQ